MATPPQASPPPIQLTIPASLGFLAPSVLDRLIRVGKLNDGGYVLPASSVEETEFLISFGISDDWSFEEHFKSLNPKVRVHAYDHSISKNLFRASVLRGFIKLLFGMTSRENFSRRYRLLASYKSFFNGQTRHFKERITNELHSPADANLEKVIQRTGSNKLFLKIDIEGGEFKIIGDILKHSAKIVGLAIEFHNTGPLRSAFTQAIGSLQEHFNLVHLHANNFAPVGPDDLPEALEITFAVKPQIPSRIKRESLPIPFLDSPNNPKMPDYQIRFAR